MAKKQRNIKNELKGFVLDSLYLSVALEIATMAASPLFGIDEPDYLWPVRAGVGLIAFGRFYNYHLQKKPSVTFGQTQARRRVLINGKETLLSSVPLNWWGNGKREEPRVIKYREPKRFEHHWDVALPSREATIRVYEPRLLNLCETAYRRERSGIPANERHPLSRNYFTRQHRPRFPLPLYSACLLVLDVCDLLDGRSQGASGRLRFRPRSSVELAKERFGQLD